MFIPHDNSYNMVNNKLYRMNEFFVYYEFKYYTLRLTVKKRERK